MRSSIQKGLAKFEVIIWFCVDVVYVQKLNTHWLPIQISPGVILTVSILLVVHCVHVHIHTVFWAYKNDHNKLMDNKDIVI